MTEAVDPGRVNEFGQPIGEPMPGWTGRSAPVGVRLDGRYVRVEPATAAHAEDLFEALGQPDEASLWTYRPDFQPATAAEFAQRLESVTAGMVTFAIVPSEGRSAGRAQGLASLMRADPANGAVEVGFIIFGRGLQRTRAATEALTLLARHVFDDLGYRRFEWKCDSLNEPSRVAAARLGFTYEGRFRQAVVYHDRNRDTDWFSITDAEWPAVRAAYDAWLDPDNFHPSGRQLTRLSAARPT